MMSPEFTYLATLLKERSGLSLTPDKWEFVRRRLEPLAERHGFTDWRGLVEELQRGNKQLERALVESLTTRDTSFFRDPADFRTFRDSMLPKLMDARRGSRCLRIWCAGSASGQEPYSLAMILEDLNLFASWDIEILATDLSDEAIGRGQSGLYSQTEVQRGLSPQMLAQYLRQDSHGWWIDDRLRRRVRFRALNLLHPFSHLGTFDVIFCRNVLMYFDTATKEDVVRRLCERLAGDGHLVLGAAESLEGLDGVDKAAERMRALRRPGQSLGHSAA